MKTTTASGHSGLLRELLVFSLSVVPCVLAFGWATWPLYAIWAALGGARIRYADHKTLQDSSIFATLVLLLARQEIADVLIERWAVLGRDLGSSASSIAFTIAALAALWYIFGMNHDGVWVNHDEEMPPGTLPWTLEHPQAFIIPSRTTHTRIFPKSHSFGYDYLLCGFPIVPAGTSPEGIDLADGRDQNLGRWWFRLRAKDYLTRGQGSLGFYRKLKAYLREKGVEDAEWSYAYLVTAPRFFGYSFNPASFWYIYNNSHQLTRMITEVNNTFGERHLYLLDGSSPTTPVQTPDEERSVPLAPKTTFTDYWTKEFHVSPFNSRKGGGYAQRARIPFTSPGSSPKIDISITLKSSKDHPKIVARLFSVSEAMGLDDIGLLKALRFIARWWMVGFLTFPRILKEAFKLYFRRGLHVWFRPEVLGTSMGRLPTPTETLLHRIFKRYLFFLVHESEDPFWINIKTAIPDEPNDYVATTHRRGRPNDTRHLEMRVSTGAFYSRFIHYAHTSEAFDRECLFTDEKNRTMWISQPALLPELLTNKAINRLKEEEGYLKRSYLAELRWALMRKLRCPPAEPAYPISPTSTEFEVDDIREHDFSELDRFVRGPTSRSYAGDYRRAATKLFLAQRYAFGFTEVIDLLDLSFRAMLCWVGAEMLLMHVRASEQHRDATAYGFANDFGSWITAATLGLCHVFGLSKGYR